MNGRNVSFAVFASGRGSNFQAIVKALEEERLHARLVALVCDRPDAPVVGMAKSLGVATIEVPVQGVSREEHEDQILRRLLEDRPDYLVLAGYRRILTQKIIREFSEGSQKSSIINIHPSLLPAFPGLHSYRKAFEYGCRVTGVTVHFVSEEVDGGPIIAQEAFSIADCVSAEEVETRGLKVEHRLLPKVLESVFNDRAHFTSWAKISEKGRSHVRSS